MTMPNAPADTIRRDPSRVVSRAARACSAELAVAQGRVVLAAAN